MPINKKVNAFFFNTWSHEMAYVLGFFFADGNISTSKRGAKYIAFYSSDQRLIQYIKRVTKSQHKISKRNPRGGRMYRIQIGSYKMAASLKNLGIMENKTTRIRIPNISKNYLGDFIRGYFDGDGNVWHGKIHQERKTQHQSLRVYFTSTSFAFLTDLKEHLADFGLRGGYLYRSKKANFSRLQYSTKNALKIKKIMYNGCCSFCLERKKRVFEQFTKNMRS